MQHLTRAVDLLEHESMSPAKAGVLSSLASVYVLQGRLDDAIQTAGDAGVIASELGLDDLRAWSHQTLALAWLQQQDVRAIAEFERAATIARTLESYDGAMIEHNYGICLLALGDLAGAGKAQTDAKRRAARLGLTYITQLVDAAQGCLLYHSGDWDGAARAADRMIAQADEDVEPRRRCGGTHAAGADRRGPRRPGSGDRACDRGGAARPPDRRAAVLRLRARGRGAPYASWTAGWTPPPSWSTSS